MVWLKRKVCKPLKCKRWSITSDEKEKFGVHYVAPWEENRASGEKLKEAYLKEISNKQNYLKTRSHRTAVSPPSLEVRKRSLDISPWGYSTKGPNRSRTSWSWCFLLLQKLQASAPGVELTEFASSILGWFTSPRSDLHLITCLMVSPGPELTGAAPPASAL